MMIPMAPNRDSKKFGKQLDWSGLRIQYVSMGPGISSGSLHPSYFSR